ncbi:endosome protein [Hysterangium stoloniferum]|nr:endosome protein [Hysterangium stoloniferum]
MSRHNTQNTRYAPPLGPPPSSSNQQPCSYSPPHGPPPSFDPSASTLPGWTASAEQPYEWGLKHEATTDEYEAAEQFCKDYPLEPPRLLDSRTIDEIRDKGPSLWQMIPPNSARFQGRMMYTGEGTIIATGSDCKDTCLLSNYPVVGGYYCQTGQKGVYYEITVNFMDSDATVAFGSACRPYPMWRLPGWNRLSAGLHLDDMRKFFEDPDGGRDYTGADSYLQGLQLGDTFGFGYEFATGNVFFTRNGGRLPNAFIGVYLPPRPDLPRHDVFAAVGVSGRTEVHVNFGRRLFMWKPANESCWKLDNHIGILPGHKRPDDELLPAYN